MMNEKLLRFLSACLPYTNENDERALKLMNLQEQLSEADRIFNEAQRKSKSMSDMKKFMLLFCGIGLVLIMLAVVVCAVEGEKLNEILYIFPTFVLFAAVFAVTLLSHKYTVKKNSEKASEYGKLIKSLETEIEDVNNEIRSFALMLNENGVFDIIPPDYFYTYAIEQLSLYIRKGMADSIKEAILLYEEDIRREQADEHQRMAEMNRIQALRDVEDAVKFNTVMLWLTSDKR